MATEDSKSDNKRFTIVILLVVAAIVLFSLYTFRKENESSGKVISGLFYDLESNQDLDNLSVVVRGDSHSGSKISMMNDTLEYGVTVKKKLGDIPNYKKINSISYSFFIKAPGKINEALAVMSVHDAAENQIEWQGNKIVYNANDWIKSENSFEVDFENYKETDILRLYIWNKDKSIFSIDDILINFKD